MRRAGVQPLDRILPWTFLVATALSIASFALDLASGTALVLWAKAGVVLGFGVAAALASRRWHRVAVLVAVAVVASSLGLGAEGLGPSAAGFFRLWALMLVPLIVVLGTIGDLRLTVGAGAAVLLVAQVVAHRWGLAAPDRLLNFFVLALGAGIAAATALMLNESKRQTLHDQRASKRVNRRLELSRQGQARAERLALLGRLAASMAHEVNNPLAFALANVRFVADELTASGAVDRDELRAALVDTEAGLNRIDDIVQRMSAFQTPRLPARTEDVAGLLARLVRDLKLPPAARAELELASVTLPAVPLDELRLSRVLEAIVANALEAPRVEGRARLVSIRSELANGQVRLLVDDSGPGFGPTVLPRLFEPFAAPAGPGRLGLSLALARELVRSVGGDVRAANRPEGGARVTLELPVAR
jgi:C4-dicarboxylate-specific signal transduction histidine kinase